VAVLKKSPTCGGKTSSKNRLFARVSAITLVQTGLYMGKGFAPPPSKTAHQKSTSSDGVIGETRVEILSRETPL
jgi:hypothetical protein